MIRFFLVFNRLGQVRLVKWYAPYTAVEKEKLKTDLHRLVCRRKPGLTNVLEYKNYKIIYRPYAALYMCMCVELVCLSCGFVVWHGSNVEVWSVGL
jgi:hypothetical protein